MKFLKVGGVILGALVVTTLGINASDIFSNNSGSLLGQIISTDEGGCPSGMTEISVGQTFSCVDIYEVSPSEECPVFVPVNGIETQSNLNTLDCSARSVENKKPWTNITREQAQVACVRSGKRLPTASEWYLFALGTPDTRDSCNTTTNSLSGTGDYKNCVSATGVYDTIGNVWEWTSDDVIEGVFSGRKLPNEGYVTQVASDGVATVSGEIPKEEFFEDYIWINPTGAYGMLRGGFYGSKEDAGVYSVHAKTLPTAATAAIGFRCVL